MAEPGDDIAGARGHGRLRASDGDREQAVEVLKDAFVDDRLTKDEFDARVTQAFTSRTYAELATVTADLPAVRTAAQPRIPAREQHGLTMKRAVVWSACMIIPTAILMAIGWAVANRTDSGSALVFPVLAFCVATVVAGTMISVVRDNSKRSRGQLSKGRDPEGHRCD